MPSLTPTEVLPYRLPEVDEELEDTPKSVEKKQQKPTELILAIPATPAMLASINFDDQIFILKSEVTAVIEGEEKSVEFSLYFPAEESFHKEEAHISDADAANRARLELLARQYVSGKLAPEEEARLAIASERVRRLIPRVTVEDLQALEQILEDAEHIESADIERRRRLGID